MSASYNTKETPQYLETYTSELGTAVTDTCNKTARVLVHAYKDTDVDQEHVFRIGKAEKDMPGFQSEVMFATSMAHYLNEFIEFMEEGAAENDKDGEYDVDKDPLRMKLEPAKEVSDDSDRELEYEYVDARQKRVFQNTHRALRRLILACTDDANKDPFTREGKPQRQQQLLFLNQGVTQAALYLMSKMAETNGLWKDMSKLATDPGYKPAFEVASLCWRFIRQASLAFPAGGTYTVMANLEIMLQQVPYGIRVMDTLVEVFNDNEQLNQYMDSREGAVKRTQLFKFAIDCIRDIGPVDKFLQFLANLCSDTMHTGTVHDDQVVRYRSTCTELLHTLQYGDPFEPYKREDGRLVFRRRVAGAAEMNTTQAAAERLEHQPADRAASAEEPTTPTRGGPRHVTSSSARDSRPAKAQQTQLIRIGQTNTGTNAYRMFAGTGLTEQEGDEYVVPIFIPHDFSKKPEKLVVVFDNVRYPVRLRSNITDVDSVVAAFQHAALDIFMPTRLRNGVIEINARSEHNQSYENWVRLSDLDQDDGFDLPKFFIARINNKNPEPPRPTLTYHIATLRLLTMLCDKRTENVEALRNVYSLDELLAGLSDEEQSSYEVRASYADFLSALYTPSIPEVSTLVKWYYGPEDDGGRDSASSQMARLSRGSDDGPGSEMGYGIQRASLHGDGHTPTSSRGGGAQSEEITGLWQSYTTPEHKQMWINTATRETSFADPEVVTGEPTVVELVMIYDAVMAALTNRCAGDNADLDGKALTFCRDLLQNLCQLLHNPGLQATFDVDQLMVVESMLQGLLTKLHAILIAEKDHSLLRKTMSPRVRHLISPFTEICKLLEILSELALNDYVDQFCLMYERVKRDKITALEIHKELAAAWPTRIDWQLRDELTDLLAIDDDYLRNNVVKVLGNLHDRHDKLLEVITSLVYVGDLSQASVVRTQMEEIEQQLRQSLEKDGAQRCVGFINSLTRDVEESSVGRSVKQHLQRQLGVHTMLFDCVLTADRFVNAAKAIGGDTSKAMTRDDATVVQATFKLLENFAAGNPRNQKAVEALFEKVDLTWGTFMEAGLGMAEALTAVYRGNAELCANFSAAHIRTLVKECSKHADEMSKHKDARSQLKMKGRDKTGAAYVSLLRMLTVVDGAPIPSNQDLVLKTFIEFRDKGVSICLDPEFWLEESDDERFLRLPSLIDAGKEGADPRLHNARLDYHIEVVRLMAACADSDGASSRKLRMMFPIQLVASAVDSDRLADEVRVAYLHFFDIVFVKPCAMQIGFARELYISRLHSGSEGEGLGVNIEAVQALVKVIKAAVHWTCVEHTHGSAAKRLFPIASDEGGGAISFLASVFESNILECIEEDTGKLFEHISGAKEIFDETNSAHLAHTLTVLMEVLLNKETGRAKIGLNGVAIDSPLHVKWMETTRHLVSSLKASPHFDSEKKLLHLPEVDVMKAKKGDGAASPDVEQYRLLMERLHLVAVETHATDCIVTFSQMVELAACAWGDENKREKFIWAKLEHKTSEADWHAQPNNTDDQFKLRRYLADIMKESITFHETTEDPSKVEVRDAAAAEEELVAAPAGADAGTGYAPLETADALNQPAEGATSTMTQKGKRRSVFFAGEHYQVGERYEAGGVRSPQEPGRARNHAECLRLTQAVFTVAETSLGSIDFAGVASLLFACINGAVLRRADEQQKKETPDQNADQVGSDDTTIDSLEEYQVDPRIQTLLADQMNAANLVCIYLDTVVDRAAASRAARLGILLLSNSSSKHRSVQVKFKETAIADAEDNGHTELFDHIRLRLRSYYQNGALDNGTPEDHTLTTRILRMLQLLCEGHMSWWQGFLREQTQNTKSVDLVTECANLFNTHVEGFLQKVPSAATMAALSDHDPRLTMVQAALDLLTQAAATLTELCQGPCIGNQERLIARHVVELCPRLLAFLTLRQQNVAKASAENMTEDRLKMRKKRFDSFKTAELAIIQLLMALVEGGNEHVVSQTIEALRKANVRHIGDGIKVLIANMNHHAVLELTAVSKETHKLSMSKKGDRPVPKNRQGEVEATTEPILLHSKNANTINSYYILLQTLADKENQSRDGDEKADGQFVAKDIRDWEPDQVDMAKFNFKSKKEGDKKTEHFSPHRVLSEVRGIVKKIEIVRDNVSELVYFPVPKECVNQLSDGFVVGWRDEFYKNLCRDNAPARVNDLVGKIYEYHAVHNHQKWISNTSIGCCGCFSFPPLYYMQKAGLWCDRWTVYNTLTLNCLLIIGFVDPDEVKSKLEWVNFQLYVQGLIHLWTSSVKVMVYFMQYPYLEVVKEQDEMRHFAQEEKLAQDKGQLEATANSQHFSRPEYWKRAARAGKGKLHCCARLISWNRFIFNEDFMKTCYMILCIVASALGALVDPFFFAFHLLELFFVVQLLQIALHAVARNGKQLAFAVAMGLILTYCYAVLGWKLIIADDSIPFSYGFGNDPDWGPNSTGVTFYDWIIIHWDMGLRDGPHGPHQWKSGSTPVEYILLSVSANYLLVLVLHKAWSSSF